MGYIGVLKLVILVCHTASKPSNVIPSEVVSVTAGAACSVAGAPRVNMGVPCCAAGAPRVNMDDSAGAATSTLGDSSSVKIRVPSFS